MTTYHEAPNRYVNHLVLKVIDLDRAKQFYTETLGLLVLDEEPGKVRLGTESSRPFLTLTCPAGVQAKEARRTGLYHFALLMPRRSDLGRLLRHLEHAGYPVTGGADHGVSEALYLQDPDDNGIEVYVDTDDESWNWEGEHVTMKTDPLDFEGLLKETGQAPWEGMPADTLLGHIHLHVADLQASRDFYVDILGFEESLALGDAALFLSTGHYHHHIGLNTWNGVGANPQPPQAAGMSHFDLRLPDPITRETLIQQLKRANHAVSVEAMGTFTEDPSGNRIRLVL